MMEAVTWIVWGTAGKKPFCLKFHCSILPQFSFFYPSGRSLHPVPGVPSIPAQLAMASQMFVIQEMREEREQTGGEALSVFYWQSIPTKTSLTGARKRSRGRKSPMCGRTLQNRICQTSSAGQPCPGSGERGSEQAPHWEQPTLNTASLLSSTSTT